MNNKCKKCIFGIGKALLVLCLFLCICCTGILAVSAEDETPAFEVIWSEEFVSTYGEELHAVTAKYYDELGAEYTATVSWPFTLGPGQLAEANTYQLQAVPADPTHVLTNKTVAYTVQPKKVSVVWSQNLTGVYGDAVNTVTAHYMDVSDQEIPLTVSGLPEQAGGTYADAGEYVLTVSCSNPNYVLEGATEIYRVTPREVAVTWDGVFSHIYGENAGNVTAIYTDITGQPVSAVVSAPSNTWDADHYVLSATTADGNYRLLSAFAVYTVYPKAVTVTWSGLESIYGDPLADIRVSCKDGQQDVSISLDRSTLPLSDPDAGQYWLTVTTADPNYTLVDAQKVYTVHPRSVAVEWEGTFASDFGASLQLITATYRNVNGGRVAATVQMPPEQAEAGGYVLTATTDDGNYVLTDTTRAYVVREISSISALRAENEALRSENATLQGENQALEAKNSELQGKITALEGEIIILENEIASLETEILGLESKIGELSQSNAALQQSVGVLTQKMTALQTSVSGLTAEISALGTEKTALKQKIEALQTKSDALEGEVAELNAEIQGLSAETKGLNGQIVALQGNVTDLQGQDKTKVVAIILLAAALLLILAGIVAYLLLKDKNKVLPTKEGPWPQQPSKGPESLQPTEERFLTDAECEALARGINETQEVAQAIQNDLKRMMLKYEFPSQLQEIFMDKFQCWRGTLNSSIPSYEPVPGTKYNSNAMISRGEATGEIVKQTVIPGKRIGYHIISRAEVTLTD